MHSGQLFFDCPLYPDSKGQITLEEWQRYVSSLVKLKGETITQALMASLLPPTRVHQQQNEGRLRNAFFAMDRMGSGLLTASQITAAIGSDPRVQRLLGYRRAAFVPRHLSDLDVVMSDEIISDEDEKLLRLNRRVHEYATHIRRRMKITGAYGTSDTGISKNTDHRVAGWIASDEHRVMEDMVKDVLTEEVVEEGLLDMEV